MNIEDVVRKFRNRHGFRVADYGEVGIPVWLISVQIVTLVHKKISPLEEFALKCVNAGLTNECEIASFLGIDVAVVRSALGTLIHSDSLSVAGEPGSRNQTLRVTGKGKRVLEDAIAVEPEESSVTLFFDGVLRRVEWYSSFDLLKRKQLQECGSLEIPASPGGRPTLNEVTVEDVARAVTTRLRAGVVKRNILAIKSVRTIESKFLPAVAIVYKSEDSQLGTQIGFAIDGKLSELHEIAFARAEGPERLRVERSFADVPKDLEEVLRVKKEFLDAVLSSQADQLASEAVEANNAIEESARVLDLSEDDAEKAQAKERLEDARTALSRVEDAISKLPVRFLYVFDHPEILQRALDLSRKRLMIISPWIKRAVVDATFVRKAEELLKKGVEVYIGYGLGESDADNDSRAVSQLLSLADKHKNFHFVKVGDTHAKVLVQDDDVVVTSFNWLSFRGDPTRTFRDEQGVLLRNRALAEEKFAALLPWFAPAVTQGESS